MIKSIFILFVPALLFSHKEIKVIGNEWKIAKTKNIQFKYPGNWIVKEKNYQTTTRFGLITNDQDPSTTFFPVEIWEMSKAVGNYEGFLKNAPQEYFIKATDGEPGKFISTRATKFKNFQSNNFIFLKNKDSVEITTVNNSREYYMLIYYKNESLKKRAMDIFNSIIFLK
jgi:hypothetical protein